MKREHERVTCWLNTKIAQKNYITRNCQLKKTLVQKKNLQVQNELDYWEGKKIETRNRTHLLKC